jgi:hypothetical protein
MTLKDWLEIIVAFIAGGTISTAVTVRVIKSKYVNTATTTQTGNRAGGDIVGRDKRS